MHYGMFYMNRREQSGGYESVFQKSQSVFENPRTHSPAHQTAHTDSCKTYHIAYTTASLRMNTRGSKNVGDNKI